MTDKKPSSFDEFDRKLDALRDADSVGRDGSGKRDAVDDGRQRSGLGTGMQVGIEMVGGVIGGVLIGLGLDYWLDTAPLMLALFVVLGAAAGMMNAHRYLKRLDTSGPEDSMSDK